MPLDEFRAWVNGYSDRLIDIQGVAVHAGFWAAYYNNAKHPKPVDSVVRHLESQRVGSKKSAHSNDVDVEGFLATENEFLKRMEGSKNGE